VSTKSTVAGSIQHVYKRLGPKNPGYTCVESERGLRRAKKKSGPRGVYLRRRSQEPVKRNKSLKREVKMTEDDKVIRIIAFSGKKIDWIVWSEKFLARARRKHYRPIHMGQSRPPKESSTTTTEENLRLRELNILAYEDIMLSIDGTTDVGRVAFQLVRGAKTQDLPSGDARMAWVRLENKYQSKTTCSRLDLKKKFINSSLKSAKDDPDVWISELEDLRNQLAEAQRNVQGATTMTDHDFMEHILNNLPKEYESVVNNLENKLDDRTNPLTIQNIQEALNLKFERMKGKKSRGSDENEETALYAGGYKGVCFNCGKRGHKAVDCNERDNKGKRNNNNNNNNNNKTGNDK